MAVAPTVFFFSDYGVEDEFVGVVHAVIAAQAPATRVIDLTHAIAPFDVRAGSHTLWRAVPHIGSGVVLGVVDPGCGDGPPGRRPGGAAARRRHSVFVGPDNGLLVSAAEEAAEAPVWPPWSCDECRRHPVVGVTFDGRDLFAPAAAALAAGRRCTSLGDPVVPASLVRLAGGVVRAGPAARRPAVSAGGDDLDRSFRQPPAGGHGGRCQGGGSVGHRSCATGRQARPRKAAMPTGCRARWCPVACRCAAWTPSATSSEGSWDCWSTPTATWPWWPAKPQRRTGSTWSPVSWSRLAW